MSNANSTANESLNYPFLLLSHMVCTEQQIHRDTAQALQELASQTKMGEDTIAEMEKILTQDKQRLSVEEIASKIAPNQQQETLRQLLAMGYVDGFFSPLERELIEQVAQIWNGSIEELQQLLIEAERLNYNPSINENQEPSKLSVGALLLKGAESILSRALVTKLAELVPEPMGYRIQQLQREILLAGPEYSEAVQRCAAIASEDYKLAEAALKETRSALANLGKRIEETIEELQQNTLTNGDGITAKEIVKQLESSKEFITADIIKEIDRVRESLRAKQRALNYFSIAFIGKTKTGKSTLHAIITGGGWDAIGIGGQRTTRFNRVYEWKNIRIIDTPGIGAPGGKTDEEIVASVIEESDLICYVVTNDSIQETEFQFLKQLKQKAKPLIILLNVKNNLRDARRLEYFLNEPNTLLAMEGKSGLGGHIERIRRYAKQHYANDYFDIIPVMLLAAQMASEPEHQGYKDKLFKASQIQDFLDSIRESLVKHGVIRRSQTLLGSTVGAIEHPCYWITQQIQVYQQLIETLKNQRKRLHDQILAAGKDNLALLQQKIADIFQDLLNSLPEFAEENWNFNEDSLKRNWEHKLKAIKFDDRLQNVYNTTNQRFNQEVQEAIEEIGSELTLIAQLGGVDFRFYEDESPIYDQTFERIGGSFLRLSKTIITSFKPSVNKTVMMGAVFLNNLIGIFKSPEEKRRFAVQRVSKLLAPQIRERQQAIMEEAMVKFREYYRYASGSMDSYFEGLIQGLESLIPELETPKKKFDASVQTLNLAYAKRIVDWCLENYEPLTEQNIHKTITKVERNFGSRMTIETKFAIQSRMSTQQINQIIQEDVSIQRIQ